MYSTILFIFSTFWIANQAQIWNGTFQMNSTCITTSCCCVSRELVVTRPTTNTLSVNANLTGVCFGLNALSDTEEYPNGYTLSVTISLLTLDIILSNDSNTLTITNSLMPQCNGKAVRKMLQIVTVTVSTTTQVSNSAMHQYMNMMMMLWSFILFICMKNHF
ncbi:hypothetical protein I4U23_012009 [Adineta vaga]|nr:hypothetical protein I4U23_012009 [Adineta vaga]